MKNEQTIRIGFAHFANVLGASRNVSGGEKKKHRQQRININLINRRMHGEWGALSQTNNSIALLPKVIIVYIDGLKCVCAVAPNSVGYIVCLWLCVRGLSLKINVK